MAAAELAWAVSDAELAAKLWDELRGWSGWGLSTYGVAYLGAADTWLGVAAATMGRDRAAQELLRAGAAQDERRGAVVWRDRALTLAAEMLRLGQALRAPYSPVQRARMPAPCS